MTAQVGNVAHRCPHSLLGTSLARPVIARAQIKVAQVGLPSFLMQEISDAALAYIHDPGRGLLACFTWMYWERKCKYSMNADASSCVLIITLKDQVRL